MLAVTDRARGVTVNMSLPRSRMTGCLSRDTILGYGLADDYEVTVGDCGTGHGITPADRGRDDRQNRLPRRPQFARASLNRPGNLPGLPSSF